MLTVITLPENFTTSLLSVTSDFFTDLAPVTVIIMGVILSVLIVTILINALKK